MKAREIKKRIKSVSNTRKITKTMEMVATARAAQVQRRVEEAKPYLRKLQELAAEISRASGGRIVHPLLAKRGEAKRIAVLVIVGNRGLCGAYNHNILVLAGNVLADAAKEKRAVDLYVSGRKGTRWFDRAKQPMHTRYTQFDHKPAFQDVAAIADELMSRYTQGELDEVRIVYGQYVSAAQQVPSVHTLLPPGGPEGKAGKAAAAKAAPVPGIHPREPVEFIFEPDPKTILDEVLPLSIRTTLFMCFLESATSEQIARRIAMKNATDNAEDMINTYRRRYNRARQTQITSEIADIVGGAAAVK